jgi:hypothetical protein
MAARAGISAVMVAALVGCSAPPERLDIKQIEAEAGGFGPRGDARMMRSLDRASLALASRFDPSPRADRWDRPPGWAALNLTSPPGLGLPPLALADARAVNADLPAGFEPVAPAQPFYLPAAGPERARAMLCLTQAIYYEAALEPPDGQAAVAQTVLNRLRHPAFPKSVCGVVYQGASQPGCQFSFACDGSRDRPPIAPYWQRAQAVAQAALDGFVEKNVGTATYYHADYVFPAWAPQMLKISQIGAHIFYRFPGPAGAEALNSHYQGGELRVSMAGPPASVIAAAAAAKALGEPGGAPPLLTLAAGPTTAPTPGRIVAGRRIPTAAEIAEINARLERIAAPAGPSS